MIRAKMRPDLGIRDLRLPGIFMLAIAALSGCAGAAEEDPAAAVETQLAGMSVSQRAAQTVAAMLQLSGDSATPRLRAEIATGSAGALLVPANEARRSTEAIARLRAAAPWPLLVLVRLGADSAAPTALAPARWLAPLADERVLRQAGREAGAFTRGVGGDIALVGLSRLNRDEPLSALQVDPERLAAGLSAYVAGVAESGVGTAVSALEADDTLGAPLDWDRARLEARELGELSRILEPPAAPGAVQIGSVRLPALTGDSLPLPLSAAGTRPLLRRDLGFEGVVVADLSPGSRLVRERGAELAAVELLAAGTDLLLGVANPSAVVDAIVAAVEQGRLGERRLREAAGKVMLLRTIILGDSLAQQGTAASAAGEGGGGAEQTHPVAVRLARSASRGGSGRAADSAVVVALRGTAAGGGATFEEGEGPASGGGDRREPGRDSAGSALPAAAPGGERGNSAVDPGTRTASGGMSAPPANLPPIVWPPAPVLRVVPPDSVGMTAALGPRIDAILREALEDSVFSGAAVAVGRSGGLVLLRGYGASGREGTGAAVDPRETLFDLASLTKVVGTATAVALLVDEGRMDLDAPVRRYLPGFTGEERERVLVRHLLTHTSGLPSGLWVFGSADSPQEALRQVMTQPLLREPGERVEYSDLGMMLLAAAAERAAEMPLDRYLAMRLFAPLGMQSTMYLPPVAVHDRTVPTAEITEREFPLRGIVHDANSFRLGGIAGHAGLFSTARDLSVFAQMMLNRGSYGTLRILSPGVVDEFTRRQPGAEQRALGWDTPSRVSSAGAYFSAASFGHTGYTGTSLWIDPESGLFVVLLTNRTYTDASAREILELRGDVHDAAARAVTDRPVRRRSD